MDLEKLVVAASTIAAALVAGKVQNGTLDPKHFKEIAETSVALAKEIEQVGRASFK